MLDKQSTYTHEQDSPHQLAAAVVSFTCTEPEQSAILPEHTGKLDSNAKRVVQVHALAAQKAED